MNYIYYIEGCKPLILPCSKGLSFNEAIDILERTIKWAGFNILDAKIETKKFIYSIKTGIHEK